MNGDSARLANENRAPCASPTKVRWGVIGSTGIARRRTIPEGIACAANAELVAVFGRNGPENARIASEFGARAADSVETLLQATRTHLDSGRIGRPVFARAQLSCWHPADPNLWRQDPALSGGGALGQTGHGEMWLRRDEGAASYEALQARAPARLEPIMSP